MNYKTIYAIVYKESTTNSNGMIEVESGVCEWGFNNEDDAINMVWEMSDEKMNVLIDEFGNEKVYRESNSNGDWQMVKVNNDTYEFWVHGIGIPIEM